MRVVAAQDFQTRRAAPKQGRYKRFRDERVRQMGPLPGESEGGAGHGRRLYARAR